MNDEGNGSFAVIVTSELDAVNNRPVGVRNGGRHRKWISWKDIVSCQGRSRIRDLEWSLKLRADDFLLFVHKQAPLFDIALKFSRTLSGRSVPRPAELIRRARRRELRLACVHSARSGIGGRRHL